MTHRDNLSTRPSAGGKTVVLGAAVAWAVTAVGTFLPSVPQPVWIVGLVLFLGCWLGAKVISGNVAERPAGEVDEYEGGLRSSARDVGWSVLLGGAVLSVVALSVAGGLAEGGSDWLLHRGAQVVAVLTVPGAAAPTFVLAWKRRVDPEDLE